MNNPTSKVLTGNSIKYIAIVAMLIDHIAWCFVPLDSVLGQIMHIIGRTTAPIMCFFIAEGYYHTRNIKKYAMRLTIFAIISHFAFIYMTYGKLFVYKFQTSVIYTLLLGLLALWIYYNVKNQYLKYLSIIAICFLVTPGDWDLIAILWILNFGINHDNVKERNKWFIIINLFMIVSSVVFCILSNINWYQQLFQSGVFLALPLLYAYNGKRGKGGQFNKWVFYIFYPLHLLILGIIKYIIL